MEVIYDLFTVPMPSVASEEKRSCKQKRKFSGTMEINPKKIQLLQEVVNSKKENDVEPLEPTKIID